MSLSKFSANLAYTSAEGCEYESKFKQSDKNPEATQVLLDTIEHLTWMAVIAGKAECVKEAFESGFALGDMRRKELDQKKFEVNP